MIGMIGRLFGFKTEPGKVICHVGPPKTATTVFQTSLQEIKGSDVCYLGTFQPREKNKSGSIYSDLMMLISTDPTCEAIEKIQGRIDRELKSGTDLILSEEMILVNQDGANFEQKIHRMHQIIGRYNCVIVVTLREPIAALKSLYSEIYFRQKTQPGMSFEKFLDSGQARVFDYPYLLNTLNKCGFNNVRCLSIRRGQNKLSLADFTGCVDHEQQLKLGMLNKTEKKLHEQIDALMVPISLKEYLDLGYSKIAKLYVR